MSISAAKINIESFRRVLKGQRLSCPEDAVSIGHSVLPGHVEALLAMIWHLGFDRLIASKHSIQTGRILAMNVEWLLHPAFKLARISHQ